jgi:hypothetical protein
MSDEIQVLRTLDKADRMGPLDIFALLTKGRRDQSGDFTPGCGLTNGQAFVLTGFVFSRKEPQIWLRLQMIEALEETVIDDAGRTAWDQVLDWYEALPEPKNIGWIVDDLIAASKGSSASHASP